jgi:hypothetical protein
VVDVPLQKISQDGRVRERLLVCLWRSFLTVPFSFFSLESNLQTLTKSLKTLASPLWSPASSDPAVPSRNHVGPSCSVHGQQAPKRSLLGLVREGHNLFSRA